MWESSSGKKSIKTFRNLVKSFVWQQCLPCLLCQIKKKRSFFLHLPGKLNLNFQLLFSLFGYRKPNTPQEGLLVMPYCSHGPHLSSSYAQRSKSHSATNVKWSWEWWVPMSLKWRHNDCISNHATVSQITGVLIVCSTVYSRSTKTSKLRVTGLCD